MTVYNPSEQFSASSNPSGAWSYGYSSTLGSPFILYNDNADRNNQGSDWWRTDIDGTSVPAIVRNSTASQLVLSTIKLEAGELALHPGPNNEHSILRFTAPSSGSYRVKGYFSGRDVAGATTSVFLTSGQQTLFEGEVSGFGPSSDVSFDVSVFLDTGSSLDFAVNHGQVVNFYNDTTGLSVQISDAQTSVLNSDINSLGRMPPVVTGSTSLGKSQKSIDVSGVAYTLALEKLELVDEVVEHAFLQDIAAMGVWPGQVIQSKALLSGDVAAIGPFPRQPGTIQITTELISTTPRSQSVSINDPDAAKVNKARRDLINTINPTNAAGLLKTSYERAYTMREVGVKLGLSVKGSTFGVDANATFDDSYKSTVVVAVIRQVFYSVTFTPQSSEASGFWPDGQVSYQNLAPYVGAGNPPLYVDSVQYGRLICVTVQGSFSGTDITAALKGSYKAAVEVGASLDVKFKSVLENSQVKIYTNGVPGYGNFQDISSVEDLQNVYRSGLSFSPQNPGTPISFTCRHIADNSLAKVRLTGEYTRPLSAVGADINQQRFPVYDGPPNGGFVNTQIRVNPSDYVKISATGTIFSGVFASQPHGPEGWLPNHKADSQAPLPSARTYCLVHRFGTGSLGSTSQQGWIETGAFWEGEVPSPGSGGTLQLNINDPNPLNGDPAYKWSVSVDVKRAGAGAVGIYV
jgi:hypothetical protein